ncbi:hypothetical protein EXIGLDRAFT_460758 [Exidia glandulosa HHB12029]|uniref:Uncharacterized protein n=1 Tax=Exidia glandulosa HHB12029 TaxID=1314781 RepID=A0A165B1F6_EXIGL|nr:hypothetical protein EXIGLDRAFT_460758 [Exidia glandulosa HHB12029]
MAEQDQEWTRRHKRVCQRLPSPPTRRSWCQAWETARQRSYDPATAAVVAAAPVAAKDQAAVAAAREVLRARQVEWPRVDAAIAVRGSASARGGRESGGWTGSVGEAYSRARGTAVRGMRCARAVVGRMVRARRLVRLDRRESRRSRRGLCCR